MKKQKITISVNVELLDYIRKEKKETHRFSNISHAFEYAMYKLIKDESPPK